MRKLALLIFLLAAPALYAQSYSTSFPTVQNPLSEGGNWINANGIAGFTNVAVSAPNKAVSTQTNGSGFTDATAVLTGTWGRNQTVQATYHTTNAIEENELRILTTIAAGGITGYEFNCSGGYVEIVRWDGGNPLSFTILIHDGAHRCVDGNVIKATSDSSGNLRFFINGTQTTTAVDTTYITGSPGIGLNTFLNSGGVNSDHWLSDFSATATGGSAVTATLLPSSLSFGSQNVGTPSIGQNVTLTNTSGAGNNLTVSSITITGTNPGDFSQTNTCPASITPGNNCTITVKFTPSLTGSRTASLSVATNALGTPQITALSGTGSSGGGGTVPWSAILSPSRAIDWKGAGLPPTLPDGETTVNPWTPPVRSQCLTYSGAPAPLPTSSTPAQIQAAMAACGHGTYVPLAAGTFAINAIIRLEAANGVTLRGNGASSTIFKITNNATISFGNSGGGTGSCTWLTGLAAGSTSLTMNGCTGSTLSTGQIINLQQCDTGYSGAGCLTGADADNGGVYVCGEKVGCQRPTQNTSPNGGPHQNQTVLVTSVSGGPTFTVNFTPAIYMSNWNSGNSPTVSWLNVGSPGGPNVSYGLGLEDLTIDLTPSFTNNFVLEFRQTYGSWVKGIRIVGNAPSYNVIWNNSKNSLFMNNYIDTYGITSSNLTLGLQQGLDSDNLTLNNIFFGGLSWEGSGQTEGDVMAFNYGLRDHTQYYEDTFFQHSAAGSSYTLFEGNTAGDFLEDNTHGTHNLNSWFRNYAHGWDPPYLLTAGTCASASCFTMDYNAFARFENAVGNALGSQFITTYEGTLANGIINNIAFGFGSGGGGPTDALTQPTALRWGNATTVSQSSDTPANSGVRFVASEIPTTLTGNAAPYNNIIPGTQNLPCSFFLAGYNTSASCTPPTGGTGLSWWKVCKTWTTFPTSCASSQAQPFPYAGPDVTGGPYVNGHAYDNPAAVAFNNLPIDPAYQQSFPITNSSWSGGTETLTVSGLTASSIHVIGGFQITGIPACNSLAGAEFVMTGSNAATGTIQYALAANPGSCVGGTMKWPDVRQFDERVYQLDSGGPAVPNAPTNLTATVAGSNVNLAWTLPSGTLTSIKVYRSTVHGGPYSLISTLGGTVTTFVDTPGTGTFFYVVTASNVSGESARSNEASATIGGAQTVTLLPASLTYAAQLVGTPSTGQNVTLTNTSGAGVSVTISNITFVGTNPGDFSQTNTCPGTLSSGASCVITVKFTPAAAGSRTASLEVFDTAAGSPQLVSLTGTGTAAVPGITLVPSSIDFSSQAVSTTSTTHSVVLTNTGTGTLTITSITLVGTNSADFGISNTCGASVAPSGTCNINLTFTPSATGIRTASAQVADNAAGSPHLVSLQGTGITVKCLITGTSVISGITITCGP